MTIPCAVMYFGCKYQNAGATLRCLALVNKVTEFLVHQFQSESDEMTNLMGQTLKRTDSRNVTIESSSFPTVLSNVSRHSATDLQYLSGIPGGRSSTKEAKSMNTVIM
jgi:hypothetical protein